MCVPRCQAPRGHRAANSIALTSGVMVSGERISRWAASARGVGLARHAGPTRRSSGIRAPTEFFDAPRPTLHSIFRRTLRFDYSVADAKNTLTRYIFIHVDLICCSLRTPGAECGWRRQHDSILLHGDHRLTTPSGKSSGGTHQIFSAEKPNL
jgi:hypothetical protein